MSADTALILARQALETTLRICGPALIAALVVGVLISIFQVATSIQDPNLALLPRIGVTVLVLFLLLPGIIQTMTSYTIQLFLSIPRFAH
jgi:flagellar biosynthetic protein FliQ